MEPGLQATGLFRQTWLRVLRRLDAAIRWLAPSSGVPHLRVPCPHSCGWAEKYAQRTRVERAGRGYAWPPTPAPTPTPSTAAALAHPGTDLPVANGGDA